MRCAPSAFTAHTPMNIIHSNVPGHSEIIHLDFLFIHAYPGLKAIAKSLLSIADFATLTWYYLKPIIKTSQRLGILSNAILLTITQRLKNAGFRCDCANGLPHLLSSRDLALRKQIRGQSEYYSQFVAVHNK